MRFPKPDMGWTLFWAGVAFVVVCFLASLTSAQCMTVPPICGPGTDPLCLCDSNGRNCSWVCVGN